MLAFRWGELHNTLLYIDHFYSEIQRRHAFNASFISCVQTARLRKAHDEFRYGHVPLHEPSA